MDKRPQGDAGYDARPEPQQPKYVGTAIGDVAFDSLAVTAAGNICVATIFQGGITTFTPHKIDDDSGVGTQFAVGDLNGDGKPDVAVANKKGVFIFVQEPAKSSTAANDSGK